MKTRNLSAFTLVEILMALSICGIIMAAGIAPLLASSRSMNSVRSSFANENRERTAIGRIFQDVREVVNFHSNAPFLSTGSGSGMGENGFLMVWTKTPSYSLSPMRTIVWGIPPKTAAGDDLAGLYRWIVSDDAHPDLVTPGDMKPEDGSLMLRGARSVTFESLVDGEWKENHRGAPPEALRVKLKSDYGDVTYEEQLPVIR
jgi:prepilin-type N-terminal cleavage/methylation domain-containing protein